MHKPLDYSRFEGIDVSDEEDERQSRMCGCGAPNCQMHVGSKPAIASVESADEVTCGCLFLGGPMHSVGRLMAALDGR